MDTATLLREWEIITRLLPAGWRELARSTGAFRRGRKVRSPDVLLLLILLHVVEGLSLRQAAARAQRMGVADVTDVGLHKRLRQSGGWLHAMAAEMYALRPLRGSVEWTLLPGRRVRVVDATYISEPGSTGSDWRIHYVLELPSLECDFLEVTDPKGGETYKRLPIEPGDLILGDRAYARREGVAHVLDGGGDVLVRLNATNLPLQNERGEAVDLPGYLRTLKGYAPGEWRVSFLSGGRRYQARLCAVRKSEEATERSRARVLKKARRRNHRARPETVELAGYLYVLTSLGPEISTPEILELYRARWQVELAFKRLKSLLATGHLPKYDPDSARAWLYAKLLAVLLIERLSEEARFFSPWGFPLRPPESVEGVH